MLTEIINYKDFNDVDRTEEVYFNISKDELLTIQAEHPRGLEKELDDAVKDNDIRALLAFVRKLVKLSYGIKDPNGRFFRKSPEILADFEASAYYSDFMLSLFENGAVKGLEFIKGVLPPDLIKQAQAASEAARPQPQDHLAPQVKPSAPEIFEAERAAQAAEHRQIEDAEREQFLAWKRSQGAEVPPPREFFHEGQQPGIPQEFQAPITPTTPEILGRPQHEQ